MIDALVFPDVRECLSDLIDGAEHLGESVRFVWYLPADSYGSIQGPFPIVQVVQGAGTEGYVDRVDRVTLECYAPGTDAVNVLESVKASICGDGIDTPHGYLDSIFVVSTPVDVPYQSDTLNKAVAIFDVTSRPIF
ncbi:hypothetical protein [Arthrobacter sp. MDT1-65]